MGRTRKTPTDMSDRDDLPAPAKTLEGRQNQLINLAYDLAERRMRDGTATSQETTHFLKLGSTLARLEEEQLHARVELLQAQVENYKASGRMEEKIDNAIAAMRSYQGLEPEHPDEYDDYY